MPSTVPTAFAISPMIRTVAAGGHSRSGQHFERPRLQRVAGQDRDGLAEGHVARGLAAPQIVVVQRRQIVVDQRIGVQHLNRRAQFLDALRQRSRNRRPRPACASTGRSRLPPGKRGVAHGPVNRRGTVSTLGSSASAPRSVSSAPSFISDFTSTCIAFMITERDFASAQAHKACDKQQRPTRSDQRSQPLHRESWSSPRSRRSLPTEIGTTIMPSPRAGPEAAGRPFTVTSHAGIAAQPQNEKAGLGSDAADTRLFSESAPVLPSRERGRATSLSRRSIRAAAVGSTALPSTVAGSLTRQPAGRPLAAGRLVRAQRRVLVVTVKARAAAIRAHHGGHVRPLRRRPGN